MEFEVLKLIKEFGKKQEKSTEEEGTTEETDQLIVIDYKLVPISIVLYKSRHGAKYIGTCT